MSSSAHLKRKLNWTDQLAEKRRQKEDCAAIHASSSFVNMGDPLGFRQEFVRRVAVREGELKEQFQKTEIHKHQLRSKLAMHAARQVEYVWAIARKREQLNEVIQESDENKTELDKMAGLITLDKDLQDKIQVDMKKVAQTVLDEMDVEQLKIEVSILRGRQGAAAKQLLECTNLKRTAMEELEKINARLSEQTARGTQSDRKTG